MKKVFLLFVSAFLLFSCAKRQERVNVSFIDRNKLEKAKKPREKTILREKPKKEEKTKVIYRSHRKALEKALVKPVRIKGKVENLSLTYDYVDIVDFINQILGDVLKVNYLIPSYVKGTLSIRLEGSFSKGELFKVFKIVLESNGYTLSKKGGIYVIEKLGTKPLWVTQGKTVWVYRTNYVRPSEIVKAIRPLLTKDAQLTFYDNLGLIVLIEDNQKIKSTIRLAKLIDTEPFSRYDISILKLNYADARDLSRELENMLSRMGLRRGYDFSIIPIPRLDYVVTLASSEKLTDRIISIVKLLDVPVERGEKNVYIYKAQHVEARKLSDTLIKFLSKKGKVVTLGKKGKKSKPQAILTGEVVIVPDETTNTLLIESTPEDYEKIKRIIKVLDAMPRQVLIEVLIAEISLEKELEHGVEWWLKAKSRGYKAEISSGFGLAGSRENLLGFTYYGVNPDDFWNFLYALATESQIKVLSSPHILVRDNEEATIDVGQEVPVITTETVGSTLIQGTAAIDRRISYKDVGIILKVKPHISEEGFVTLDITQESSEAQANTISGIDSPIILKRKVKTTLMVQDGHSVVIGGIIDHKRNVVKKKVPLLGDIPLLGKAFSYEQTKRSKTELIVMLTPYVISSVEEADVITSMIQERLKVLKRQ